MSKLRLHVAIAAALLFCASLHAAQSLSASISDAEFWKLVESISEPNGPFISDNLISNEIAYGAALATLRAASKPDGAYIGVGPEQNFTYIAALKPKVAFVVDIRRDNMLVHLMYKALFELSENRAQFVSRLFSRRYTKEITERTTGADLMRALDPAASEQQRHDRNIQDVLDVLTKKHGFVLSEQDQQSIRSIYRAFFQSGPAVSYSSLLNASAAQPGSGMPRYIDVLTGLNAEAVTGNYLGSEETYRFVRDMQMKNLIIPVVGDFGGPKAVRAIGQYLRDHGATLTAFYTSNVESYLFDSGNRRGVVNGGFKAFVSNRRTLPTDASSFVLRIPGGRGSSGPRGGPTGAAYILPPGMAPMHQLFEAVDKGAIGNYADLFPGRP